MRERRKCTCCDGYFTILPWAIRYAPGVSSGPMCTEKCAMFYKQVMRQPDAVTYVIGTTRGEKRD